MRRTSPEIRSGARRKTRETRSPKCVNKTRPPYLAEHGRVDYRAHALQLVLMQFTCIGIIEKRHHTQNSRPIKRKHYEKP